MLVIGIMEVLPLRTRTNQKLSWLWVFLLLYITLKGAISMKNSSFLHSASAFFAISLEDNPSISGMEVDFMGHAIHTYSTIDNPACSRCSYRFTGAASFSL